MFLYVLELISTIIKKINITNDIIKLITLVVNAIVLAYNAELFYMYPYYLQQEYLIQVLLLKMIITFMFNICFIFKIIVTYDHAYHGCLVNLCEA